MGFRALRKIQHQRPLVDVPTYPSSLRFSLHTGIFGLPCGDEGLRCEGLAGGRSNSPDFPEKHGLHLTTEWSHWQDFYGLEDPRFLLPYDELGMNGWCYSLYYG